MAAGLTNPDYYTVLFGLSRVVGIDGRTRRSVARSRQPGVPGIHPGMRRQGLEELHRRDVRKMIQAKLDNKEVIYGFGHAVLRVEDPRARVLRKVGEEICPNDVNFRMVKLLAEVGPELCRYPRRCRRWDADR